MTETIDLQVLATEVLVSETEQRTVVTSSGAEMTLNVATGRLIADPGRLLAAVTPQVAAIGMRVNGALQVLDADPATQAWLTVRVPVALAGA